MRLWKPCNHAFPSDYEGFWSLFAFRGGQAGNTPFTVKNRLKSLQVEYYSSHKLSKMSIRNLRRSLLNLCQILKDFISDSSYTNKIL